MTTVNEELRIHIKPILLKVLRAMDLHEKSYDDINHVYDKSMNEACVEVCDGDEIAGNVVYLTSTNWNDIQDAATEFGIGWINGEVVDTLPKKPDDNHYWSSKDEKWVKYNDPI